MQVRTQRGAIQDVAADTIVVNLFEGVQRPRGATEAVDLALNGEIQDLILQGDVTGESGEITVLYPKGLIKAQRVLVVGLGAADRFDLERVRRASAVAMRRAQKLGAKSVATIVHGAGIGGLEPMSAAQAVVVGAALALYRYNADTVQDLSLRLEHLFRAPKGDNVPPLSLTIVEYDGDKVPAIEQGVQQGAVLAQAVGLARDLSNMPPNIATPQKMADTAIAIAKRFQLQAEIGDKKWAEHQQMGAFLGVAKGAGDEPRFVILHHRKNEANLPTYVLVGKGITFDTGGISLKPSANMGSMKYDMSGAAAVLGAMYVVGALNLPLRVIGLMPCTENKPDADAYRPSDVIRASNGKTIEIISTDAEGRLALADALAYAQRFDPDGVIDLATLTGSAVIALGENVAAGLFCNSDDLRDKLLGAAEETFERLWPLPLYDDYRETIRSDVADLKNSGGRFGGVGTSAKFLEAFTNYPWAHLDIAGMSDSEKEMPYGPKGATGYGVRLLAAFLLKIAADR